MDCSKTGKLICELRKEKGMTQNQLAQRLYISDKAVSKWERGMGCPDISLISELAEILGINPEVLLSGEIEENGTVGGNMKKLKFYVCPKCGNIITATAEADVSCCGKKIQPLEAKPAEVDNALSIEKIENDLFITTEHEMVKEHYITFVAVLTGDGIIMKKQYPEWNLQARIPYCGRGMAVWYCSRDGLFCQKF